MSLYIAFCLLFKKCKPPLSEWNNSVLEWGFMLCIPMVVLSLNISIGLIWQLYLWCLIIATCLGFIMFQQHLGVLVQIWCTLTDSDVPDTLKARMKERNVIVVSAFTLFQFVCGIWITVGNNTAVNTARLYGTAIAIILLAVFTEIYLWRLYMQLSKVLLAPQRSFKAPQPVGGARSSDIVSSYKASMLQSETSEFQGSYHTRKYERGEGNKFGSNNRPSGETYGKCSTIRNSISQPNFEESKAADSKIEVRIITMPAPQTQTPTFATKSITRNLVEKPDPDPSPKLPDTEKQKVRRRWWLWIRSPRNNAQEAICRICKLLIAYTIVLTCTLFYVLSTLSYTGTSERTYSEDIADDLEGLATLHATACFAMLGITVSYFPPRCM